MLKAERQKKIYEYLSEKSFITVSDICKKFNVSVNTARADISALVADGCAEKTYGGVSLANKDIFREFKLRNEGNTEAKREIAKLAAEYVEEGDVIFIDSGTTTMNIVDFLTVKNLAIITSNLSVIEKVAAGTTYDLICAGEIYQRENNSFYMMEDDSSFINRYNINKCFFSTAGISGNGKVTSALAHDYRVKMKLKENCEKFFLLADSTKFGKTALYTYTEIGDMNVFLTDKPVPKRIDEICKASGTIIRLPDET